MVDDVAIKFNFYSLAPMFGKFFDKKKPKSVDEIVGSQHETEQNKTLHV